MGTFPNLGTFLLQVSRDAGEKLPLPASGEKAEFAGEAFRQDGGNFNPHTLTSLDCSKIFSYPSVCVCVIASVRGWGGFVSWVQFVVKKWGEFMKRCV